MINGCVSAISYIAFKYCYFPLNDDSGRMSVWPIQWVWYISEWQAIFFLIHQSYGFTLLQSCGLTPHSGVWFSCSWDSSTTVLWWSHIGKYHISWNIPSYLSTFRKKKTQSPNMWNYLSFYFSFRSLFQPETWCVLQPVPRLASDLSKSESQVSFGDGGGRRGDPLGFGCSKNQ